MAYQPGTILLGTYRFEQLLGIGRYTEAYRVTHLSKQQTHTLKVLRTGIPRLGSTGVSVFLARFQFECQLVEKLDLDSSHPNLLCVYEASVIQGVPVIERDYEPLGSLNDLFHRLRSSRKLMPMAKAVEIILDASEGVSALHTHGIVHRDLKPSNILLNSSGSAKVSDLYLAQVSPALGIEQPPLPDFPLIGPVGYMSPEQERSWQKLKESSDVYSLGAILFEILTGYKYSKVSAGTHPTSMRSEIPRWLGDLVLRMLSKDPEHRPFDGATTAALLRAVLDRLQSEGGSYANQMGEYNGPLEDNEEKSDLDIEIKPQTDEKILDADVKYGEPQQKSTAGKSIWRKLVETLMALFASPAVIILVLAFIAVLFLVVYLLFFR